MYQVPSDHVQCSHACPSGNPSHLNVRVVESNSQNACLWTCNQFVSTCWIKIHQKTLEQMPSKTKWYKKKTLVSHLWNHSNELLSSISAQWSCQSRTTSARILHPLQCWNLKVQQEITFTVQGIQVFQDVSGTRIAEDQCHMIVFLSPTINVFWVCPRFQSLPQITLSRVPRNWHFVCCRHFSSYELDKQISRW